MNPSADRTAIFVDVDGTLVDELGRVPHSAVVAIRRARAAGHLVFLCTGRSSAELWPEVLDIGFDGAVTAAGAYVTVGDRVILEHDLGPAAVAHARDFFAAQGIRHFFQAWDGNHCDAATRDHLRELVQAALARHGEDAHAAPMSRFVDEMHVGAEPPGRGITKVIYLHAALPLDRLREEFAGEYDVTPSSVSVFGEGSGEMAPAGVHKAVGMDAVLAHLGIPLSATVALGDGHNDVEVLAHAALGIAMGGAPPEVVAAADETTGAPQDDGLRDALARHGLLG